jgi:hypothetical protein
MCWIYRSGPRVHLPVLLLSLLALCAAALPGAWAQSRGGAVELEADEADGGSYAIPGIRVDAAGRNAFEARRNGWREAQRRAWPQLWARMTGSTPAGAPRLSDAALDAIVAGFDIEREFIGPNRYVAKLGVVFDRGRAAAYLGRSARVIRSSPMLLLPVLRDGGTTYVFERRTPWRAAWSRFRESGSSIDYVRPAGTAGDALMLPAAQAFRPDRNLWRTRFDRYGVADVLIAEARLERRWPGGPVRGFFRALHGPDARELARFALEAPSAEALPAMLDQAVARMDEAYTAALRDGRLFSESDLLAELPDIPTGAPIIGGGLGAGDFDAATAQSVLVATVATPDAAALAAAQAAVGTVPGVARVTAAQVDLGTSSTLAITHVLALDQLRYRLDQAGWRLEQSGGWVLRPRTASDAPLPAPLPPVVAQMPGEGTPGGPMSDAGLPVPVPASPVQSAPGLPPVPPLPAPPAAAGPPSAAPAPPRSAPGAASE